MAFEKENPQKLNMRTIRIADIKTVSEIANNAIFWYLQNRTEMPNCTDKWVTWCFVWYTREEFDEMYRF